jgi:putative membrane protein
MNLYEVRAGNLAQQQAQQTEVMEFGNMMAADHQNAAIELNTAASSGNYRIQLPQNMAPREAALYEALSSTSSDSFDSLFMAQMIQSHDTAIALFESASQTLTDAQLRDYATRMLPNLRMHREQAAELHNRLLQDQHD